MKAAALMGALKRSWLILVLVALGAGLVLYSRLRPVEASRVRVETGPVLREASGTGTLESEAQVNVAFTVAGRIGEIRVREGQHVRAGDELAWLDPREPQQQLTVARRNLEAATVSLKRSDADIRRAQVTLEAAQREARRVDALFEGGAATLAARDAAHERLARAEAELEAATAARQHGASSVELARASMDVQAQRSGEARLLSPLEGIVVRRLHEPGDVITPGQPVLVLASSTKVLARIWLDETVLHELQEGQEARVVLRGEPSRSYRARVDAIAAEVDRQTHEVLVDLELLERPQRLAFGQRVDGFVTLEAVPAALRVRQGACDLARKTCFVERGGRVAEAQVGLGLVGSDWVEVRTGLAKNDVVLVPPANGSRLAAGHLVAGARP
ncbi:MAG: efflux RND transporter periplasmic adaptor subunit [Myxococcaceae bacterium]|nr:efflux RND transporter periplasmic adaptor subunit [Myxococcaceae bacterium]